MSLLDLDSFSMEDLAEAEASLANPYLANPSRGLQLVTRLIAHPPAGVSRAQEKHLDRLHQLIHQSFVSLSAKDDFPAEAQAYRELLALEQSVEDLVIFPDLANKNVVGIGGGFSAGKSRFLNTLIGEGLLPESLEPTTAIPTYLTGGEEQIVALNAFRQPVPIDAEALDAISHAFHQHYWQELGESVGFAHILKLLMVQRPRFAWSNLAFLDTPGYSKADHRAAEHTDEKIALKQLADADHIIWLINAKNGTVQKSDIEFLRTLNHPRPIFFVLTQADLVGRSQVRRIMRSVVEASDRAGIERAGLMAWQAPTDTDFGEMVGGDDIRDWLAALNESPKRTTKRLACAKILDAYILHNSNALANNRELLGALNEFLLISANLSDDRQNALKSEIRRLRYDQKRLSSLVREFTDLRERMLDVLNQIVGDVAEDEEVRRGHELIYHCRNEWLRREVRVGDQLEVQVAAVKEDEKRVVLAVGEDVARLGVPFGVIRGGLRIDPLVLVKGSLLAAEVKAADEKRVTFAITNPNGME